jgi:hypothetical protein
MKSPRERYNNDPQFATLVKLMVAHLHQCNYTPTEMREAAMLASIIYQQETAYSKPYFLPKEVEEWLDSGEEQR